MILGVGIDIVEIDRIKNTLEKWNTRFLEKVFTENEINYCNSKANPAQHFAARFAAKEAFYKALPKNKDYTVSWKEIEVISMKNGNPVISFTEKSKELELIHAHLSLSHSLNSAVAVVVLEK
jgi:holo-[acyl-carrier protein] synthase